MKKLLVATIQTLLQFPIIKGKLYSTKSLGVLIEENLTLRNHTDVISKKISAGIGSVKRVRHLL